MVALQVIGWILFAISLTRCLMVMIFNMFNDYESRERRKSFIIFGITFIISVLICTFTS